MLCVRNTSEKCEWEKTRETREMGRKSFSLQFPGPYDSFALQLSCSFPEYEPIEQAAKLRVVVGFSKRPAGFYRAVNYAFARAKTKGIRFSALQKFEVIFHERKLSIFFTIF